MIASRDMLTGGNNSWRVHSEIQRCIGRAGERERRRGGGKEEDDEMVYRVRAQ
jgi:hypothetical protein